MVLYRTQSQSVVGQVLFLIVELEGQNQHVSNVWVIRQG